MTTWNATSNGTTSYNHDGGTLYVDDGYVLEWYFAEENTLTSWNATAGGSSSWNALSPPTTAWNPVSVPTTSWA